MAEQAFVEVCILWLALMFLKACKHIACAHVVQVTSPCVEVMEALQEEVVPVDAHPAHSNRV